MVRNNALSPTEEEIIIHKGTEPPGSGEFNDFDAPGIFVCKRCDAPLYESSAKFPSHCGWPSFDAEVPGMVRRQPDTDGSRTEIICANCQAHLGHVFEGEGYTAKSTRHCVNSLAMKFIPQDKISEQLQMAVFASGCYWGTEYWFEQAKGVIATTVGYAGGEVVNPSYREVCQGHTGHAESVRVFFDPRETDYAALVKLFFNTHNPTQRDGQGPDIGSQYRSVIFTNSDSQRETAEAYKTQLMAKGLDIATEIRPLNAFYPERDEAHHHYYAKKGSEPYCHYYKDKFD